MAVEDEEIDEAKDDDDAEEVEESEELDEELREYTEKVNTAMPDGSDASAKSPVKDAGNEHDSKPHPTDTKEESGRPDPKAGDFGSGTTQDAKMGSAPKPKMSEAKRAKK